MPSVQLHAPYGDVTISVDSAISASVPVSQVQVHALHHHAALLRQAQSGMYNIVLLFRSFFDATCRWCD